LRPATRIPRRTSRCRGSREGSVQQGC
jgi:hypothetical protein